ncbi:hypothetical protein [Flammeovirga sp. EKP202]|uniref:hypothetical protein n=1 Tax=Flammeovirga sp. EKP202 TaxID=2770592 RepID=UPI00165F05FC|nr:hypothetical protein [Flammeovirga sp. EKP202]MBD0400469.1 hypothetical protein [Flammeovirga sp. EKP202]
MTTSIELPCQKNTWYTSNAELILEDTKEKINVSVKFTDSYALVELMNDKTHEVYKLLPSDETSPEEDYVFETIQRIGKYRNAKLSLARKSNLEKIEVSFKDYDRKIDYNSILYM